MVFTLPAELAAIALQNKAVVYGILFRTVVILLRTIAVDLKHLWCGRSASSPFSTRGGPSNRPSAYLLQEISGFMRCVQLCRVCGEIADLAATLAQITPHNFWFGPRGSASPEACRGSESGLA